MTDPYQRPDMPPEELPFPTPAQLDLLRAALLPREQAAPAWRRWKARGMQLEVVDPASGRMFSQLWANREAAEIDDADFALLKGVYRQALAHNAVTISAAFAMAQPLHDAGIPVLYIKGAALLAVSGGRLGVRRSTDVDILVPERDAARAKRTLEQAGLVSKYPYDGGRVGLRHAWVASDGADGQLDLHWWAYKPAGNDQCVFDTARDASLLGRTVQVPSPTELLLATVANGFGGRPPAAPMRWIGDAMFLLDLEGDAVDWDRLVERAQRPGITLAARTGLSFLVRELGAPIPPAVLEALDAIPVTRRERWSHRAVTQHSRHGLALFIELELHRARRLHDPSGTPRDFLGHLAEVTGPGDSTRLEVLRRYGPRSVRRVMTSSSTS